MSRLFQQIRNSVGKTTAVSWLSFLVLLVVVGTVDAEITYRAEADVTEAWTATTGAVGIGNGMFASPKYAVVVSLSSDCILTAYEPTTGDEYWKYTATGSCTGGVFFADNYIAYLVSDTNADSSAIHAVDYAGQNYFTSAALPGTGVGTPVTTATGQYIMANSNTVANVGTFSVFDIAAPASPAYTYPGEAPFGEIGYYYNPQQGYFVGGFENRNDVFIWSTGIPTDFTQGDLNGTTYAFQLPVVSSNPLNVTVIGVDRAFSSNEPPVLANGGLNMYWATYKNEFWGWAGSYSVRRDAFDQRGEIIRPTTGRGDPRFISAKAPMTVSPGNTTAPTVYGPQADGYILKANFDFTVYESYATEDGQPISSRVVISPDETVLFYATPTGKLVQLGAYFMTTNYAIQSTGQYTGEIALSVDGAFIYVADTSGNIIAFQVADVTNGPTLEPLPGAPTVTFPPTTEGTDGDDGGNGGNSTGVPAGEETSEPGTLQPTTPFTLPTKGPSLGPEVPSASPVTSPNNSSPSLSPRTTSTDALSRDVVIAITVSVAAIIIVILLSLLFLHIRKEQRLESTASIDRPPENNVPSAVAASVVSVSANPVASRDGKRLPRYKDQCETDADGPKAEDRDDNEVSVVPVELANSFDKEERSRYRGLEP